MQEKITTIGVLTSGGDAPGMNAGIRAVVRSCAYYKINCIGFYRGFQGLIENDYKSLDARSVRNLINRGGTFLKSARSKTFITKEGRRKAYANLIENNINALVIIGGNGSFSGAAVFGQEFDFPIIGIPGTIDNDITGTDYTIGYDTALNTVVEAIDKIRDTANSHNRLFLVEVMGRDAGDIALNAGIGAGAEEILIPEQNLGRDRLVESLKHSRKSGKVSSIVVMAEGERSGKNIYELAEFIDTNLNDDYEVRVTVLGHVQRGGAPSCADRVLASRMGVEAVKTLLAGASAVMIGIQHQKLIKVPFETAISQEHDIDKKLIKVADIISI